MGNLSPLSGGESVRSRDSGIMGRRGVNRHVRQGLDVMEERKAKHTVDKIMCLYYRNDGRCSSISQKRAWSESLPKVGSARTTALIISGGISLRSDCLTR